MDDQQLTNRQKLVFHLMDKGLSNDEVARVVADLAEAAIRQFTEESMAVMTDEDKKAIEDAPEGTESEELVRKLYEARSGKNADERLAQLMEEHATRFMTPATPSPAQT